MPCTGIAETRESLRRGDSSVVDHVASVLARISADEEGLGAFLSVAGDTALQAAEAADRRIRRLGREAWRNTPLLGVTLSVKDLIGTQDLPTSRGSLVPNTRPAVDAPAVARLRAAGAIVVGKTTTSEYGWSASTVSRVAPPTRNPWAPERTAGGSSGGAAAAVAAGLCTASLGTDGAGSIRIPSAFCGVVGFKPSFGRVPYVPAGAERLAHLGPLARTVPDVAELTALITGPHPADPDSALVVAAPGPVPGRPLRIVWLEFPGTAPEVRRVTEDARPALTAQGWHVAQIDVPFADPEPALVDLLAAAEAAGTAPGTEELCDPGRLAVVRHGRSLSGVQVMRAEEVRLALRTTMRGLVDRYDLLATATVPIEPFAAEAIGPDWAADPAELRWLAWSPATYPFNLTGQPALSLPVGRTPSGLPVGLQLVGAPGADALVLGAARRVEAALGSLPPPPRLPGVQVPAPVPVTPRTSPARLLATQTT